MGFFIRKKDCHNRISQKVSNVAQNPRGMLNRVELTVFDTGHTKEAEQKSIQAQTTLLEIQYPSVKSIVHSGKTCQRVSDTMFSS